MGKRKIEGFTIDLTKIPENGDIILEDLIIREPIAPRRPFPDWLNELYNKPCAFCCKKEERMHFDHINMFDKRDSVSSMAIRGCSKEEILLEVNKCQLLCVPCHDKITRIEHKYGFIQDKCKFNKLLRKGVDVEHLRCELHAAYSEKMEGIYAGLRADFQFRAIPPIMIAIIVWEICILCEHFIWES